MVPNRIQDQEDKANIVLLCIEKHCHRLAKHFEYFHRVKDGLEHGDSLVAESITGGLTNYSYRVSLKCLPNVILFAKLSFPYALWNDDTRNHYDVQRTKNEFRMMQMFAEINPGCVPVPYLCEPVDDMMVLVTEWSKNDEQLATQAIEGWMDPKVCAALAGSIARLHCQDFDPTFNTDIRTTMVSTFETLRRKLDSMIVSTDNSRASLLARAIGKKECNELVDTMQFHYENSRDCLVHSDLHVKNILVEHNAATRFGPEGTFSVVDWEMAFAGPVGRDLGSLLPFPLCCALAHALNGNKEELLSLLNAIDLIWEEYSESLRVGGKSETFICYAFRSTIGWLGRFMFLGFFTSGVHVEDFPLENTAQLGILMDLIGVLGLKFMKWGFDQKYTNFDLAELRQIFSAAIWNEITALPSTKVWQKARFATFDKSSILNRAVENSRMVGMTFLVRRGRSVGRLLHGVTS